MSHLLGGASLRPQDAVFHLGHGDDVTPDFVAKRGQVARHPVSPDAKECSKNVSQTLRIKGERQSEQGSLSNTDELLRAFL